MASQYYDKTSVSMSVQYDTRMYSKLYEGAVNTHHKHASMHRLMYAATQTLIDNRIHATYKQSALQNESRAMENLYDTCMLSVGSHCLSQKYTNYNYSA